MSEESGNRIVLGKQIDISMAAMLYQRLSSALDSEEAPVLDGSESERIDTAGFQLLMAFRLQAELQGRGWEWINRPQCIEDAESILGTACA